MGALGWFKVDSGFANNPKIRRAGGIGALVFLYALARHALRGMLGWLPAKDLEPWYVADQLQIAVADIERAIGAVFDAHLLELDGDRALVVGWNEEWESDAIRKRRDRALARSGDPDLKDQKEERDKKDQKARSADGRTRADAGGRDQTENSAAPAAGGTSSRRKVKPSDPTPDEAASVRVVLDKLSAQNGVRYSGTSEHSRLIVAQLRAGVTEIDLRAVIGYCANELGWKSKPEMLVYLRPETLFGPKSIARYLDPARAWWAKLDDAPSPPAPVDDSEREPSWMAPGGEA